MTGVFESIRKNHWAMMAICCLLPVLLIIGFSAAGVSGPMIYILAIAVCVGSHVLMMLFHGHDDEKGGKSCH